ncbi:MAG: hypothetical protein ACLP7F_08360, partial [Acidimicrobiales bacterium]
MDDDLRGDRHVLEHDGLPYVPGRCPGPEDGTGRRSSPANLLGQVIGFQAVSVASFLGIAIVLGV